MVMVAHDYYFNYIIHLQEIQVDSHIWNVTDLIFSCQVNVVKNVPYCHRVYDRWGLKKQNVFTIKEFQN